MHWHIIVLEKQLQQRYLSSSIAGTSNPADVLSKHCGHPQLWPHIRPLLFYSGETSEIQDLDKTVARANSGDRVTAKPEAVEVKKMKRIYKAFNV